MCGRYTLSATPGTLAAHFNLQEPQLEPRYNIAPSQDVVIIRQQGAEGRQWAMAHWGLVPFWAKEKKIGYRMINAKAETLASKPAFRQAFKQRRCLVPADGFYEWRKLAAGKQPYFIHRKDGQPVAFAGLWERWRDADGSLLESCTIVTTDANRLVRPLHDRMPVILGPEHYQAWLDVEAHDAPALSALLTPYPEEHLEAYPVTTAVNNPRHEGADLVKPMGSEEEE